MIDKSAAIARSPRLRAQRIFEGSERTNPARVLDQDTPHCCGKMEPRQPWPAQHQQPAEHDEENECEMGQDYKIGQRAVDQAADTGVRVVGAGAADESKRILSMIAANLGSSRSGSTIRSEEHTSELQSHHDLVCRLLLEKKNKT